jgi:hypothetical protein
LFATIILCLLIASQSGQAQTPPASPGATPQVTGTPTSSGKYTPNFGFKVADTPEGDLSISVYTYVRYLNQMGLDPTYVDDFSLARNVQQRQDVQLNKMQIKFLGWIMNPKLRYFVYAWTSNANQGNGAQVVLAGNINYNFNKYVTLSAGSTACPAQGPLKVTFHSGLA